MLLNTDNIMSMSLDQIREACFKEIPRHDNFVQMDVDRYIELLGQYPSLYQWLSELYVYLIAKTRAYSEAKNSFMKMNAMDRRDCIEQILKVIKFQYDGLSRKATVLSMEQV